MNNQIPSVPPIVEAVDDVVKTVANPSAENILADAEFALKLVKDLKAAVGDSHPSVLKMVKSLIKELF